MNGRNGFTLLELVIAVAVLGLVMVGVVQGVRYGLKSWDSQTRQISRTAEIDGVDRVVRDLLEGVQGSQASAFQGARDQLAFVGRLPLAAGPSRSANIAFAVTADHRLVMLWSPHRHATNLVAPRVVEAELLRNVRAVEFSYWPAADQGGAGWQTSLTGSLPTLIRLHFVFMPDDPRHWPDIVAAPVVNGAPG